MQAEAIKAGDRYDDFDDQGRVISGWTAIGDAERDGNSVLVPVRYHHGAEGWNGYVVGQNVDLTWGAGGDLQRTVKYPPGTPEYEAYAAELRAELQKFRERVPPYDGDELARERQIGRLKP